MDQPFIFLITQAKYIASVSFSLIILNIQPANFKIALTLPFISGHSAY